MNQEVYEKIKGVLEQTAKKDNLILVKVSYLPHSENGEELEVLLDNPTYSISMKEIEDFTAEVNPLIDALGELSENGYVLNIASGTSEREIPYEDLPSLVGQYLEVKTKDGKKETMLLVKMDEIGLPFFRYFIKGRKKELTLKKEDILSLRMGYKA